MADPVNEWDSFQRPVQGGLVEGQFLNAAYMMIAAGPPRLDRTALVAAGENTTAPEEVAYPIGILQTVNLGHNRQFTRLWEIGSEFSFFVAGRTVGQLNLGRPMYHGPSLLRVLYAYYSSSTGDEPITALFDGATPEHPHEVRTAPGYDNVWWNLASDLFSQPIGLLIYLRDIDKATVSASYLEYAHVPSHAFATDAQGTILQEMATVQFERLVPVNVEAVGVSGD